MNSVSSHIPLACPDITEADIQAVVDVLRGPCLSLGPKLDEFEEAFSRFTGARFATAVSSGTAALHLAVRALKIGSGHEVITSPFSFVASANCILFERARPVFVDIDPVTFNLNPDLVEAKVSRRTRAILPVHVFGRPAEMDSLLQIADRHDLKVIEDSCEAIGAYWKGQHVGSLGTAGAFAFYPNKQMTTGEGGVVVTSDPELDVLLKSLRNQGRAGNGQWLQHERLGFNYRLSEINCALGLSQLSRLNGFLFKRRRVAEIYREYLKDIEELELPVYRIPQARVSWFVYVVRLKETTREERDKLLQYLREQGVACSNYFVPIHLQPFYRDMGYNPGDFPVTEAVSDSCVALPFYNHLGESEIRRVSQVLRQGLYELDKKITHSLHRSVL